jgi:hypothetical protein
MKYLNITGLHQDVWTNEIGIGITRNWLGKEYNVCVRFGVKYLTLKMAYVK